jgi:hypothetical protein
MISNVYLDSTLRTGYLILHRQTVNKVQCKNHNGHFYLKQVVLLCKLLGINEQAVYNLLRPICVHNVTSDVKSPTHNCEITRAM